MSAAVTQTRRSAVQSVLWLYSMLVTKWPHQCGPHQCGQWMVWSVAVVGPAVVSGWCGQWMVWSVQLWSVAVVSGCGQSSCGQWMVWSVAVVSGWCGQWLWSVQLWSVAVVSGWCGQWTVWSVAVVSPAVLNQSTVVTRSTKTCWVCNYIGAKIPWKFFYHTSIFVTFVKNLTLNCWANIINSNITSQLVYQKRPTIRSSEFYTKTFVLHKIINRKRLLSMISELV